MKFRRFSSLPPVVAAFITLFLLLIPNVAAFGATLIVDNDLDDCPQADFRSIQAAIAAQAGDRIVVCPGIYPEVVVLSTPNLRIEARGAPGEVVRQGTAAQQCGFHLLNTTGVCLQGFTVKGFRQATIIIEGGGANTLHKNVPTERSSTVSADQFTR